MTAVTHGADTEALRLLAEALLDHAEHTLGVGLRTQQQLSDLRWSGPDADRARQRWESTELTRIRETSRALAEAAGHVLDELEQQLAASAADGAAAPAPAGASAAPGAPSGSSRLPDLRRHVGILVDLLTNGPELQQVAMVVVASGGQAARMTRGQYELASSLIHAARPGIGTAVRVAGHLGTAVNAYDAVAGAINGDASQAVGGAGGLTAGALGGPAVGAAWGAGYAAGGWAYQRMQGTTYGDHVQRRNDMAFDTMGAWGMLIVPGNLALGVWDSLTGGDTPESRGGGGGGR